MTAFMLVICKDKKKFLYTFMSLKEGQIHSEIEERTETVIFALHLLKSF